MMQNMISRRSWMAGCSTATLAPWGQALSAGSNDPLPVGAVVTVYRTNSHADVIVGKILEGWQQKGGPGPNLKIVSLYADQVPKGDLSRGLAKKHGFRLAKTIDEALTLGTDQLQVRGVLSIGEHGDYPRTAKTHQHQYPRLRFFERIVSAMERVGQVAPVFNDKHFSHRWRDGRYMVDTARQMGFPLMAGSSLPVAWRYPGLQLPQDAEIEAALTIGYGGMESYGFHALETHQCMIERRAGGETGTRSVQAVQGDAIWKAEADGRWSRQLLQAALDTLPSYNKAASIKDTLNEGAQRSFLGRPTFYLIDSRDGLQSTVAMVPGLASQFAFAAKIKGQDKPVATWFKLQEVQPFSHFAYLLRGITHMFQTGKPAYPAERTLLTTGILDRAMQSAAAGGKALQTPELNISYRGTDWPYANDPRSPLKIEI